MSGAPDVREWWGEHPMTYGDRHGSPEHDGAGSEPGTRAFFDRMDEVLYRWNRPLHDHRPFGRLFPYGEHAPGGRVLEVGCGLGAMAMTWVRQGARVTAVDLNPVAVEQTATRLRLHGLDAEVREADARRLPFGDGSFHYAYSWGVLHHSPDLAGSLRELLRVVRPGGGFGVMLYHRHSLLHLYLTRYVEGFLHLERRFLDPLALASRYGDAAREEGNPHTWPVTRRELRGLLRPLAPDVAVRVLGTDLDSVFQLMLPGLGLVMPAWAKKPWARRLGWSLWAHGHRA